MDKYIGKKLEGRYEILELIGFGGMAVVFKAYDILEQRYVAVKILKDEYLQNEDFKRRFRNESKAIALLSHPNIVRIYDVNFSENIQYIVMEYIDGITLKEYIEQQKVVRWKEAIHFTVQILRALQHAHDNGIVHRDVKPQNIMLLEDGTIKVMDFGIARFARENGKTLSDKAIGSVHYISPEQARGEETDEKTDIYAVGVMLYEMLTGKVPFDGDTPVSIAIKQMQIEPTMPTDINPDIPVGLEEILLRAMQKDPQLRYQSAAEMLRDIDEFKRNPDVVFEYRYFNSDGTTKYFDRIEARESAAKAAEPPKKKSYMMNILAGVAAACVILAIVALFFFFKALDNKKPDIILPNLVGMDIDAAQQQYKDKLKITVEKKESSNEYDVNQIIEQSPIAESKVKYGGEVLVTISTGLEDFVITDMKGMLFTTVKAQFEAAGILVSDVHKTSNEVEAGRVIMTDPGEGTTLKKGDTVIVYVSLGASDMPSTVPQLVGKTEVEARNALQQQNLSLGRIEQVDSSEEQGIIVEQSVKEGEKLPKGSTVDVKISNGKGESSSSGDLTISIRFPNHVDSYDYTFEVYVNTEIMETYTLNPSKRKTLTIPLALEDGKINGIVDSTGDDHVTILVDGVEFAQYTIDFSSGMISTVREPDFTLLASSGHTD